MKTTSKEMLNSISTAVSYVKIENSVTVSDERPRNLKNCMNSVLMLELEYCPFYAISHAAGETLITLLSK